MFSRANNNFKLMDDFDDDSDATLLDETIDDIPTPTGHLVQSRSEKWKESSPQGSGRNEVVTPDGILKNPLPYDFLRIIRDTESRDASSDCAVTKHIPGTSAQIVVILNGAELPSRVIAGLYVKLSISGGKKYISRINESSAKRPEWNEKFVLPVPKEISNIMVNAEVVSLNWMSSDKCIGAAQIDATDIADGIVVSGTYKLEEPTVPNSSRGVKIVGSISMSLQYSKVQLQPPSGLNQQSQVLYRADGRPMLVDATGRVHDLHQATGSSVFPNQTPVPQQQPPRPAVSQEQIAEIQEMFPDFSKEVIEAVLAEASSPEAAIESILSMS